VLFERTAAELRELGILNDEQADFAGWVLQSNGLPTLEEVANSKEPAAERWGLAVTRLAHRIIQNPNAMDKPFYTHTALGKAAYGIMSFNYAFTRNVHLRLINQAARNAEIRTNETGMDIRAARASEAARAGAWAAAGFAGIIGASLLVSAVREAAFNGDKWDEQRRKGDLGKWLFQLAVSRSGVYGSADPIMQAITGLKYERDLTALLSGPHLGYFLSNLQDMAGGVPKHTFGPLEFGSRNSPNTETAEHKAVKGAYKFFGVPLAAWALSALPDKGLVSNALFSAALQYGTSNQAAGNVVGLFYERHF
jgi:hypothetical protein